MGDGLPEAIVGDAGRLRQIVLNLLSNAIKFTEQGEVVLSVEAGASAEVPTEAWTVTIEVRDTGIGIPPDRISALFESFSQVDASISRRYGGTGLGLAISRRLAESMGGTLTASSAGAGNGSTFTLVCRSRPPRCPMPRRRLRSGASAAATSSSSTTTRPTGGSSRASSSAGAWRDARRRHPQKRWAGSATGRILTRRSWT
jgi:anti-sigma regulatory factor (Ser/Thr protein kinase)